MFSEKRKRRWGGQDLACCNCIIVMPVLPATPQKMCVSKFGVKIR